MAVSRRHNIYDVELGKVSPLRIPGIEVANVRTETEHRTEATSGSIYPEHTAMVSQQPSGDFTTFALNTALAEIALAGLSIADLPTGLRIFAYKHAEGSGRAGAASHREYKFFEGLVAPVRISCDHQGDARLQYEIHATYDGTNEPFVVTDAITLPAAGSDNERFSIGKVTVGGVTIDHLKSVEVEFGQNIEREGADSDKWPTHASIVATAPVITLRGIDLEWLKSSNIPLEGVAATHANTVVYFRKRAITASGYVANGTAQHVKITGDGLGYIEEAYSSQGDGPVECNLVLPCRFDGSNAPITITPNSAIT